MMNSTPGGRSPSSGSARYASATPSGVWMSRLLPRVVLSRLRLEFQADERRVADDPGVVTGLDDVHAPGAEVGLGAVLVGHVQRSGLDDADVPRLAAVGAGNRLDALGPLPARLERQAGSGRAAEPHDIHLRLLRGALLIRRIEIPGLNTSHARLLLCRRREGPSSTTRAPDGKGA